MVTTDMVTSLASGSPETKSDTDSQSVPEYPGSPGPGNDLAIKVYNTPHIAKTLKVVAIIAVTIIAINNEYESF